MRLVLDASAAVRLTMRIDDALWLADQVDEASLVTVPGLCRTEVANALWTYVRAEQRSADDALRRLDEALTLGDAEVPDSELLAEARPALAGPATRLTSSSMASSPDGTPLAC